MRLEFFPTSQQIEEYLKLMPLDWHEEFAQLRGTFAPQIVIALQEREVVAGIAVFCDEVPEGEGFADAKRHFKTIGSVYLGFFIVKYSLRGQGIGSEFLQRFFRSSRLTKFWLVIEDLGLEDFYLKNGFSVYAQVGNETILSFGG